MNNENPDDILKISKKRIKYTEKQLSNLKTIEYDLHTPRVVISYNVLINEEHNHLLQELKNMLDLYYNYKFARSKQNINKNY